MNVLLTKIVSWIPWLMALVFGLSAILKIVSMEDFTRTSQALPWVSSGVKEYLPIILPSMEMAVALSLLTSAKRFFMKISVLMLVVFTIYLIWLLEFHPATHCSCFGPVIMSARAGVCRNILLIAMGGFWIKGNNGI